MNIDSLSGTLRRYDGKVDYATVDISLSEVYKYSNVEEVPDSFLSRLGSAFQNGWSAFTDGMEDLAVALAYSWMWLVILAVIVVAVVRVARRTRPFRTPFRKAEKESDKAVNT